MARVQPSCMVPGCKGKLELGKRDGKSVEWCPVCERRIHQLAALHQKMAEVPVASSARATELSDADLLAAIQARCASQKMAAQLANKSLNLVMEAARRGEVPMARFGRICLFGRATVTAWGKAYQRRPVETAVTRQMIEALPKSEAAAMTAQQLAQRTKKSTAAIQQWAKVNAKRKELRRISALENMRAVVKFWWQEATNA